MFLDDAESAITALAAGQTTGELVSEIRRHHVPTVEAVSDGLLERHSVWKEDHCGAGCSHYVISNDKILLSIDWFPEYEERYQAEAWSKGEGSNSRLLYSAWFDDIEEAKVELLRIAKIYLAGG